MIGSSNPHGNTTRIYKLNHAPLSLRQGISIFSQIVGKGHSPQWGIKEPVMGNSDKPEETTETKPGILLPEGLTFYTRYVQRDAKVEDLDRILADCRMDGTFIFQIGLHAPIGTVLKGKAYQLGATARMKRVQGNRVEIYLNGVDPAAGVDYTTVTEVLELPF